MHKPKTIMQLRREQAREVSVLKVKHKKELRIHKDLLARWRGGGTRKTTRKRVRARKPRKPKKLTGLARRKEIRKRAQRLGLIPPWL